MFGTTRSRRLSGALATTAVAVALAAAGTGTALATPPPAPPGGGPGPAAPSAGCGTDAPHLPGISAQYEVPQTEPNEPETKRRYQLFVPEDYDPARPLPVVLAFHGRTSNGAEVENYTGLSKLPAIVVYLEGAESAKTKAQSWQGAPYSEAGVDDVAYTATVLDQVEAATCADTNRVYATGKSNGGGFTEILACRMSDRIAAIAPVAAAFYRTGEPECAPGRPVPVIEFHGTADTTVPYAGGGAEKPTPPIMDWVNGWVARNQCAPEPATKRIEPDITVSNWSNCADGADVEHVVVDNGGHTWPGNRAYSGGGYATQTIRATDVMWEFLSHRTLGGPA
ncbi:alpha/beta hydrolase family esterase [Pseudonocardia sp. HH130630-07]|uniref:alpha/beta hydrolase family esterase n=1 Tax=Pseudonocardia sp. HH130630-07 TaxID=1690815 RepID=UPI000814D434|nr:PHB depolymerase family esterase [Pseudonocardia sp. HH130630-07]ANY07819.1 hypothetical protein AFB00_17655 [Pseudonocardia sp. HH130630-07]